MFYREISQQLKKMGFTEQNHFEKATVLPYIGTKYECPCCRGHFDYFSDAGIIKRKSVKCPKCLSLERHRLLWLYTYGKTKGSSCSARVLY